MQYIFYKKKLINGKKRRVYKKKGSKKLYLKHKGRMVNVVKYKKYLKRKQKKRIGGNITWRQRFAAAKTASHKLKNTATTKVNDYNRERMRAQKERERNAPDRNPWLTRNANLARQEALKIQERKRQMARQGRHVYGNFNLGGPARRWTFR
jgi:hypothetical protein